MDPFPGFSYFLIKAVKHKQYIKSKSPISSESEFQNYKIVIHVLEPVN